jgi:hypothetical protein
VDNYAEPVWFSKKAIANIFAPKAMKKQYRVSYDSSEGSFLVHRDRAGLPDIPFKEHSNGLHFFDPRKTDFAFVETVESNMKLFLKRQVACADKARSLYAVSVFLQQKISFGYSNPIKSKTVQSQSSTPKQRTKYGDPAWPP